MDTLTSYRGRFKDGIITTEPPIPSGEELDLVITVLEPAKPQKAAPEQGHSLEQHLDRVTRLTAHVTEDLSALIIADRND